MPSCSFCATAPSRRQQWHACAYTHCQEMLARPKGSKWTPRKNVQCPTALAKLLSNASNATSATAPTSTLAIAIMLTSACVLIKAARRAASGSVSIKRSGLACELKPWRFVLPESEDLSTRTAMNSKCRKLFYTSSLE